MNNAKLLLKAVAGRRRPKRVKKVIPPGTKVVRIYKTLVSSASERAYRQRNRKVGSYLK